MKAVSDELLQTIRDLQKLSSLSDSSLGGGTALAIRYGHRISHDIDFFFPGIIGKDGYTKIEQEVRQVFADDIFGLDYPCDIDDQFLFLRFYVRKKDVSIKVEILQNMQNHKPADLINGVKIMSLQDTAILKLASACDRGAQKDIYDLDLITNEIALTDLMHLFKEHNDHFDKPIHKRIFDLDGKHDPITEPMLLLKFEEPIKGHRSRPGHSHHRVDIVAGSKNWASARSSWRRKVRAYFTSIGASFPGILPQ